MAIYWARGLKEKRERENVTIEILRQEVKLQCGVSILSANWTQLVPAGPCNKASGSCARGDSNNRAA
jgi:hypothetical protein